MNITFQCLKIPLQAVVQVAENDTDYRVNAMDVEELRRSQRRYRSQSVILT